MVKRIKEIDIIKGILILFLLLYHTIDISIDWLGVSNHTLVSLKKGQFIIISSWMSVFFIISGYCTNFKIEWRLFIEKTIKGLLIPAIVYSLFAATLKAFFQISPAPLRKFASINSILWFWQLWFISALIISRIILYYLYKCSNFIFYILLISITALGTILNQYDIIPNYWHHRQALLMVIMLHGGQLLKDHELIHRKHLCYIIGAIYIVLICVLHFNNLHIPRNVASVGVNLWEIPLYCIVSWSGFFFFLTLANWLLKIKVFSFIGKKTLAIYCTQFVSIELSLRFLYDILPYPRQIDELFIIFASVTISLGIGICADYAYSWIKQHVSTIAPSPSRQ